MTARIDHPWQQVPAELIECAIEHLRQKPDVHCRVGFLLLDVGVETLFKVYLRLPPNVTGTSVSFAERNRAVEGNFPDLLEGISKAASSHLGDNDLAHVRYYHSVRNTLYHEGAGITVPRNLARDYAELAVKLIKQLLQVDLTAALDNAEPEGKPSDDRVRKSKSSKYQRLREYLERARKRDEFLITMSFRQIEELIADTLPSAAHLYRPWWGNTEKGVQARSWIEAGWLVDKVDLHAETVTFRRG